MIQLRVGIFLILVAIGTVIFANIFIPDVQIAHIGFTDQTLQATGEDK